MPNRTASGKPEDQHALGPGKIVSQCPSVDHRRIGEQQNNQRDLGEQMQAVLGIPEMHEARLRKPPSKR